MSLTHHLADPGSPVRRYFEDQFPQLRGLRTPGTSDPEEARRNRLGGVPGTTPFPVPVVLPDVAGWYPWGTAGTAFDYRMRYLFRAADPGSFVAATGARMLAYSVRPRQPLETGLWAELVEALRAVQPSGPTLLPTEQERRLSALCVVLGWYEQLYRMGRENPAWRQHPLVLAGPHAALEDVLATVDSALAADVTAITALLIRTHPALLGAKKVVLNPTFARSGDLGGADGDLILDGLLLEVKTNKRVSLARDVVWQLLGYLLADTDDRYRVSALGLYFARHGILWTFTVDDFLRRLSGTEMSLSTARAEFAAQCDSMLDRAGQR